jgi:hypothetical protein
MRHTSSKFSRPYVLERAAPLGMGLVDLPAAQNVSS